MNCKKYQSEIEELSGGQHLSSDVLSHLGTCVGCREFNAERAKLRQVLGTLQTVNAPTDFNFHLKAKLRKQETSAPVWSWQKLVGAGTATLAALLVGFVLIQGALFAPQNVQKASVVPPSAVANTEPAPIKPVITSAPPIQNPAQTPVKDFPEIAKENVKPQFIKPYNAKIIGTKTRKMKPDNLNEVAGSFDSAVVGAKQKTPPGIPNQLEPQKKHNAIEFLRTFGVETEIETEGLRVKQSNKPGLQTGDLIQKINNQNPQELSGNDFTEINLTVRRNEQTQEIKLKTKL